jgi:uncharacterized protein (TIGR02118 family)
MIKLVFCLTRLPHLSRDAFQRYWRETHGPLVMRRAAALRIRRYVQLHTLDHVLNETLQHSREAPEAYDGVAELWWDGAEDLAEAMRSPEGQQAAAELLADEQHFIYHVRSPLWVAEEHVMIEGE